jgi:hypothetical protein
MSILRTAQKSEDSPPKPLVQALPSPHPDRAAMKSGGERALAEAEA